MANKFFKIIGYILFLFHYLIGQSGIIIMSPDPESTVSGKDLLIAVSLIATSDLDPTKISLFLDGENITENSYIDSEHLNLTHYLHKDMMKYIALMLDFLNFQKKH